MGSFRTWLNGLFGAAIGAAANGITVLIVDPSKFSPGAVGGWKNLGICVGVSALVGAALFLKQSPTPWDQVTERRNGGTGTSGVQQGIAPAVDRRKPQGGSPTNGGA
jgi:hypothetical protein